MCVCVHLRTLVCVCVCVCVRAWLLPMPSPLPDLGANFWYKHRNGKSSRCAFQLATPISYEFELNQSNTHFESIHKMCRNQYTDQSSDHISYNKNTFEGPCWNKTFASLGCTHTHRHLPQESMVATTRPPHGRQPHAGGPLAGCQIC